VKSTSVILVLLCVLGVYVYFEKFAKFNYPGAKQPGTAYPNKVRAEFTMLCEGAFKAGKNPKVPEKFQISDETIQGLCSCCLKGLEDAMSYKQYDEIESKVKLGFGTGMVGQFPKIIRNHLNTCAHTLGYEISGLAF
jgi:hypothetical protein